MTKNLPTGCFKWQEKILSGKKINMLFEAVDLDNKIGHLFVVDIELNAAEANAKLLLFNEIYTPIFEKDWKTCFSTKWNIMRNLTRNDIIFQTVLSLFHSVILIYLKLKSTRKSRSKYRISKEKKKYRI